MPFFKDVSSNTEKVSSGGVTGSYQVKIDDETYQYKLSIHDARLMRKVKAGDTDRENFGEVIAAAIAQSALGEAYAPTVLTKYNPTSKHIDILSKYLENGKGTIDDYCSHDTNSKRSHVLVGIINEGEKDMPAFRSQDGWQMHHYTDTAKSLARALAISAIVGDHDVNPGNMIVLERQEGKHPEMGRIDFGHAFNDLLNAPRKVGGKVRDPENPIFDFFNRTNVAGARVRGHRVGDISKVWRDYTGMVPSSVLANALIEIGEKQAQLQQGIKHAQREFITQLHQVNDESVTKDVVKSFSAIHKAITGERLPKGEKAMQSIERFFGVISGFVQKNAENAIKAGQAMQLQQELNQAIKGDIQDLGAFIKAWEGKYKAAELMDDSGKMLCPWFKTAINRKAITGSLTKYILFERHNYIYLEYPKTQDTSMLKQLMHALKDLIQYCIDYTQKAFNFKQEDKEEVAEYEQLLEEMHTTEQDLEDKIEELELTERNGPNLKE